MQEYFLAEELKNLYKEAIYTLPEKGVFAHIGNIDNAYLSYLAQQIKVANSKQLIVTDIESFDNNTVSFVYVNIQDTDYKVILDKVSKCLSKVIPSGIIAGSNFNRENNPQLCRVVETLFPEVEIRNNTWIFRTPKQGVFNYSTDDSLNILYNRTKQIAETLIIAVPNNKNSLMCATRAMDSCIELGQPNPRIFWGYDGTDKKVIKTPEHLKHSDTMQLFKVMDTTLSITEVSCLLSHIAAWVHCIKINQPIVILEHDSIMLKPFTYLLVNNTLEYLGHVGELAKEINIDDVEEMQNYLKSGQYTHKPAARYLNIPLTQMVNVNYLLILGLHNYAIDPILARKLVSYVIKYGLINPADAIIEQHDFTLVQTGTYAVQSPDAESTSTIDIDKAGNRKYTYAIPGVAT